MGNCDISAKDKRLTAWCIAFGGHRRRRVCRGKISLEDINGGELERVDDGAGWQLASVKALFSSVQFAECRLFGECSLTAHAPDLIAQ